MQTETFGAVGARIAAISTYLPEGILTNDDLASQFADWPAEKIFNKTGIRQRHIASEGETALDLGCGAARRLFETKAFSPSDIDFLILCTQAPDYILPSSASVMQHRLGLPTSVGALDINLGCSGFVYCVSLACGLIASGAARNVLLVTADTYSKYIHKRDKSVRTLFGDGAAATVVSALKEGESGSIGPFVFGTDGSGAGDLIVEAGGFRTPACGETALEQVDRSGNVRTRNNLYMNGGAVLSFTLREVPEAVNKLLAKMSLSKSDFDAFVLHQANKFMLDTLQKKLGLSDHKVPRHFESIGNTVSSTIPFVLASLMEKGDLSGGSRIMLIGFGVGLSWAAASISI